MRLFLLLGLCLAFSISQAQTTRPNIVFCLADDWGWPHAGAYGDQAVKTPNFDRLAKEGALFQHAFVSSPSCTPSRNAFITGKFHWELGPGANLWSTLPKEHESFIHLLEDHGYAIGRNNAKTWGPGKLDSWEEYHGKHPSGEAYPDFEGFLNQAENKPFFYWVGTSDPHRDYEPKTGINSGIDLSKVHLFTHFPDNELVRSDVADYYFEVQRWDSLVGSVIQTLEEKGLLENTIIIMTGDHGMPFPRGKGNLYDSGVRVPFAVRWGTGVPAGRSIDDFISFADIAPTLLTLAQVEVPKDMTGRSFANILTSSKAGFVEGRKEMVFGRERHTPAQEKPNMAGYPSRGLRTTSFLYIKNYHPDRWPAGTGEEGKTNMPGQWYSDCDGGPTKTYILENKDKDQAHARYFQLSFDKRPADELYDLKNDPDQVHNLASDPRYSKVVARLQKRLHVQLIKRNDPRAKDPNYTGFDDFPYYGTGGGKK